MRGFSYPHHAACIEMCDVEFYYMSSSETSSKFKGLWQGRIGPARYFLGLTLVFIWVLAILMIFFVFKDTLNEVPVVNQIFPKLSFLAVVVPLLGMQMLLAIRRCHDLGYSGWLYLLSWVPVAGIIFNVLLLFKQGEPRPNRYGEPPSPTRPFIADIFNQ